MTFHDHACARRHGKRAGAFLLAAYFTALGAFPPRVLAFTDAAILGQILGQEIAAYVQIVKTVANTYAQLQRMKTMLEKVGTGNVLALANFVQRTERMARAIDRDLQIIGTNLETVDAEHKAVYQKSFKNVPPSEFRAKARKWNEALYESSQAAMRAQTNVATLEERAATQASILDDSAAASGIVAQLQLVVRNLALIHDDLAALQRTLDTSQRVAANLASGKAADTSLVEEQHRLSLEKYTERGAPVHVSDEFP